MNPLIPPVPAGAALAPEVLPRYTPRVATPG
jgi:hypothetical protein